MNAIERGLLIGCLCTFFACGQERMIPAEKGEEHLVEVVFALDDKAPSERFHTVMAFWISATRKGTVRSIEDYAVQGGVDTYKGGVEHSAECAKLLKSLRQPRELPQSQSQIVTVKWLEGDKVLAKRFAIENVPPEVHQVLEIMGVSEKDLNGRLKFSNKAA